MRKFIDPDRRQFLAFALLPDLQRLLENLQPPPDSYQSWFRAVKMDDAAAVQQLLTRGFDINTIEPERFDTALLLAVREKSMKVLALLLNATNLQLDAQSKNGDTALMIAAFQSDAPTVKALIEKGAAINRPGWTALHYAAASGNRDIIRYLLDQSAYIDAESPNRTTPLMMAARGGHFSAVTMLLDEGADQTLLNEAGWSAADFAKEQGYDSIVRFLNHLSSAKPTAN
jgi:ankyrin repeat protein